MRDSIALYFRYIGISFASQMQYRVSFLLQTMGHGLGTVIDFIAIWALFQRFDRLLNWSLYEVAVFYGTINVAFAISDAFSRGFDILGRLIKNGEFDRYLLRPHSLILQLFGYEVTLRRIGRLTQGIVVFAIGASHLDISWTFGKALVMVWTIAGASCLFMGLIMIQATLSFWTTESLEIMNTVTYGGVETAQYPLTIYHPYFRKFFTFVIPLACVSYFPVVWILDKPDPLGTTALFQCLAPAAGMLFLLVGRLFWTVGARHYSSTGS